MPSAAPVAAGRGLIPLTVHYQRAEHLQSLQVGRPVRAELKCIACGHRHFARPAALFAVLSYPPSAGDELHKADDVPGRIAYGREEPVGAIRRRMLQHLAAIGSDELHRLDHAVDIQPREHAGITRR